MSFDELVAAHCQWIARLALRFCRNCDDAADLAQDTLLKIYASKDRYDRSRDFKPWALTVMANLYKSQAARRCRCPVVPLEPSHGDACASERADSLAVTSDLLAAIGRSARRCVGVECAMLYAEGYSYAEIAGIVGIKPGTVKSRVAAGRAAVAALL